MMQISHSEAEPQTETRERREVVARYLFLVAFAMLGFAVLLSGVTWNVARQDGCFPTRNGSIGLVITDHGDTIMGWSFTTR